MIIFDLDGTLADCEHRRHFVDPMKALNIDNLDHGDHTNNYLRNEIKKFKPRWDKFYDACDKDLPIQSVIEVFTTLSYTRENEIHVWSGRIESTREKTMQWLEDNVPRCNWIKELKLRPDSDSTPDDQLKEKWLDEAIAEGKTIDFVVDDRPKVVRMYRRRGIFVFDVNQSGKEF